MAKNLPESSLTAMDGQTEWIKDSFAEYSRNKKAYRNGKDRKMHI